MIAACWQIQPANLEACLYESEIGQNMMGTNWKAFMATSLFLCKIHVIISQ